MRHPWSCLFRHSTHRLRPILRHAAIGQSTRRLLIRPPANRRQLVRRCRTHVRYRRWLPVQLCSKGETLLNALLGIACHYLPGIRRPRLQRPHRKLRLHQSHPLHHRRPVAAQRHVVAQRIPIHVFRRPGQYRRQRHSRDTLLRIYRHRRFWRIVDRRPRQLHRLRHLFPRRRIAQVDRRLRRSMPVLHRRKRHSTIPLLHAGHQLSIVPRGAPHQRLQIRIHVQSVRHSSHLNRTILGRRESRLQHWLDRRCIVHRRPRQRHRPGRAQLILVRPHDPHFIAAVRVPHRREGDNIPDWHRRENQPHRRILHRPGPRLCVLARQIQHQHRILRHRSRLNRHHRRRCVHHDLHRRLIRTSRPRHRQHCGIRPRIGIRHHYRLFQLVPGEQYLLILPGLRLQLPAVHVPGRSVRKRHCKTRIPLYRRRLQHRYRGRRRNDHQRPTRLTGVVRVGPHSLHLETPRTHRRIRKSVVRDRH